MANTYTQLYIQIVFSTKRRRRLVREYFREELEKYICGIIINEKCKPLATYCNPDHIHIFVGIHPAISISELARKIKSNSSKWINERNLIPERFEWQNGFGAFSYAQSQMETVINYVLNQPNHHKETTYKEEYVELLDRYEIDYNELYVVDPEDES